MIVWLLVVVALPGSPDLYCGARRCVLGEFPTQALCSYAAYNSEEIHDKTVVVRCVKETRS